MLMEIIGCCADYSVHRIVGDEAESRADKAENKSPDFRQLPEVRGFVLE